MEWSGIFRIRKIFDGEIALGIGIFLIALCVCMVSPLNPLSHNAPSTDSSVFMTIARGMANGEVPYLDYFDHKGPLLYLINFLGWSIGGTLGVWLMELLLMGVSVFFAYKTARLFAGKSTAYVGVLITFISLVPFFDQGNFTEEYALPVLFIALFYFTKYFLHGRIINNSEICITGFCFGCTLLLRPNMVTVWVVFCSAVLINLLVEKRFAYAMKTIFSFIVGVFLCIIPILFFLYAKGAFFEFINQYFIFNVAYATDKLTLKLLYDHGMNIARSGYIPIFIAVAFYQAVTTSGDQKRFFTSLFLAFVFSVVVVSISQGHYEHYKMVFIPLFLPCAVFLTNYFMDVFSKKMSFISAVLFFCIIFITSIMKWSTSMFWYTTTPYMKNVMNAAEFIGRVTNDDDTITVVGNNCEIYLYSNRKSASKYIYQTPIAMISEKVKNEFENDIINKKPKLIVFLVKNYDTIASSGNGGALHFLIKIIDRDYKQIYSGTDRESYIIFARK